MTGLVAFLHVRQSHNLRPSRARNSSVRPSYVFCRSTVTQSEALENWELKPQTRLQFCPFDSLVNLSTPMLEAQAIHHFLIVLKKTTSREHMFPANMSEHMFREHLIQTLRTWRTYVHEATKIYIYIYIHIIYICIYRTSANISNTKKHLDL